MDDVTESCYKSPPNCNVLTLLLSLFSFTVRAGRIPIPYDIFAFSEESLFIAR